MNDNLSDIAPGASSHFKLWFYAAVLRLIERIDQATGGAALDAFPFLEGYAAAAALRSGRQPVSAVSIARWEAQIADWEAGVSAHLPLRALATGAGLDRTALLLLICAGLPEEDSRFGAVFESLHGGAGLRRPTLGLLSGWWGGAPGLGDVRAGLRRLVALGLLHVPNPDAPAAEWLLHPPGLLWECLQGSPPAALAPWADFTPPERLARLGELLFEPQTADELVRLPELLERGAAPALVVRGPLRSGRRTLAGALARALGRGRLLLDGLGDATDPRWRLAGPLAAALGAVPVVLADPAPGELAHVPELPAYSGPVLVVTGPHGGLRGPAVEGGLTLSLGMPGPELRRAHWAEALGPSGGDLDALGARFRLTGGAIRRIAAGAQTIAALDGRAAVNHADARRAAQALGRQTLDTLATFVPASPETDTFAASAETLRELDLLATHCRNRERLAGSLGAAFGGQRACGVRALFSGPSGAGKTLAARRLAAAIDRDLYRIDLSAVVNKYIGETEKNLGRVLARAEELDVVLLLDEGDALLTRRTSVHSANDRYANLETNFLLQRLESFEGILVITTNAAQRIDDAFQRRMDVLVSFGLPEPEERLAIWRVHLPGWHAVDLETLEEVAYACALSGGQIRNAACHAGLLALDAGQPLGAHHLLTAVGREYRKAGAICPLPGLAERVRY